MSLRGISACLLASSLTVPGLMAEAQPAAYSDAELLFAHRIQPLLKARCLACHGDDEAKLKGGLDLRTLASARIGGDSGDPSFSPGKPEESPLYLAISREHEDWEPMPPKEKDQLTPDQIAQVREWIAGGAPWPGRERSDELLRVSNKWSVDNGVTVVTSGGLDSDWTNRKYKPEDLWAYRPLKKPALPHVSKDETLTGRNPIDAFIDASLEEIGLPAAPLADRRTLIRRATYDLTGLPPTPEEVQAFVSDPSPDEAAFAKVVDRLLASPHYGEQWGRHWLDIARYADTSGLANDFARGNAWRYRDYVVRAFNEDKPYDQFVREQLAGDELYEQKRKKSGVQDATSPGDGELLIAPGFLRMGPWELTSMEVPKVARQKLLDDMTDTVGQVFLAQPLQCARCHDHKFDPVPTRDYYGMLAVFATTQIVERPAGFLSCENREGFDERKYLEERERHHRLVLRLLDQKSIAAAREWYREKGIDPAPFEAAVQNLEGKGTVKGRDPGYDAVRAALMKQGIPEAQVPPKAIGFTPEDYGHERIARKGLERIRWERDRYEPIAFSVYSGRTPEVSAVMAPVRLPDSAMGVGELEETHILPGGDPFADGARVVPSVLSAATSLGSMSPESARVPEAIEGRRLALADWIVSPDNPLTARVMLNRIWGWHFGGAIAGNPNNFGANGKKPSHPALLDWLAATFVEGNAFGGPRTPWSVKAMHRLIMMSRAYRRSSEHPDAKLLAERDPHGVSNAVFTPRRLSAEELRDSMLFVSGELNPVVGGIPVRPEINPEAALQPREVMGTFAEAWQPSPLPGQRHRRSLYVLTVRGQRDPFMEVFNSPSPDLSCEARDASTVTPQVFALFNSEASLDRALALASRVLRESGKGAAAMERLFQIVFNRPPTVEERALCSDHLSSMLRRQKTIRFATRPTARSVEREAVEENTGERFTFSEPLEAAADFVPDLKSSEASAETRALADLCLVLLNSNEFAYLY
ncbi:MAG: PSD1 domain-containing protein [Opitutaceae bacterium]|nr:PSD1 domain-containing protein [Opitutaceae bacterium]